MMIFISIIYYSEYIYYYHSVDGNSCPDVQNIIENQIGCQPQDTYIDLNITKNALHLIPDVAMVKRCGGNCAYAPHSCVPRTKTIKSIPFMAILSHYPHGIHGQNCGTLQIEEHLDCHCNCSIAAEECTSQPNVAKRFDGGSCRCLCNDTTAQNQCISRGLKWDDENCRCVCPIFLWRHCPTGLVFDYENTCHCIPKIMTKFYGLVAAIIVSIICILGPAVGVFIKYRKQLGFSKNVDQSNRILGKIEGKSAVKRSFYE